MNIRPARQHEAAVLSALALESKAHWGYSAEALASWTKELCVSPEMIASRPTFVAALDEEVVGFYSLLPSDGSWRLEDLWVRPHCIGRGVGRGLVAHALRTAAGGGASSVTVDADPNAERFYLACGAARFGIVPAPISGHPARVRPQLVFDCRPA